MLAQPCRASASGKAEEKGRKELAFGMFDNSALLTLVVFDTPRTESPDLIRPLSRSLSLYLSRSLSVLLCLSLSVSLTLSLSACPSISLPRPLALSSLPLPFCFSFDISMDLLRLSLPSPRRGKKKKKANHAHVVELLGAGFTPEGRRFILLEHLPEGTLGTFHALSAREEMPGPSAYW